MTDNQQKRPQLIEDNQKQLPMILIVVDARLAIKNLKVALMMAYHAIQSNRVNWDSSVDLIQSQLSRCPNNRKFEPTRVPKRGSVNKYFYWMQCFRLIEDG